MTVTERLLFPWAVIPSSQKNTSTSTKGSGLGEFWRTWILLQVKYSIDLIIVLFCNNAEEEIR